MQRLNQAVAKCQLLLVICLQCVVFCSGVKTSVKVTAIPSRILEEGSPLTLLCEVDGPIDHCSVRLPSSKTVAFAPYKPPYKNLSYPTNASFGRGQCGFTAPSVDRSFNGSYECHLTPSYSHTEKIGRVQIKVNPRVFDEIMPQQKVLNKR